MTKLPTELDFAEGDLEAITERFLETRKNPWSMYNELESLDTVMEFYVDHTFDETMEFIRRADLRAYRAEEYYAGNL